MKRLGLVLAGFVAGSLTAGATAYAVGSSLTGCVQEATGLLRVVQDASDCAPLESSIVLPERGPQGPPGVGPNEVQLVWVTGSGILHTFGSPDKPRLLDRSYLDLDPSRYWANATYTTRYDLWGVADFDDGLLVDGEVCVRVRDLIEDVVLGGSERCELASEIGENAAFYATMNLPPRRVKLAIEGTTEAVFDYGCDERGCKDPIGGLHGARLAITPPG